MTDDDQNDLWKPGKRGFMRGAIWKLRFCWPSRGGCGDGHIGPIIGAASSCFLIVPNVVRWPKSFGWRSSSE